MKLKAIDNQPKIEVTIYGQYDYSTGTQNTDQIEYSSEEELNNDLYHYIICLDFYDKILHDPNYKLIAYYELSDLKHAVRFYFENEHNLQLTEEQFNKIMLNVWDIVPYIPDGGYTIVTVDDIEIRKDHTKYNIEYDENDVKEAIEKLVNSFGGE